MTRTGAPSPEGESHTAQDSPPEARAGLAQARVCCRTETWKPALTPLDVWPGCFLSNSAVVFLHKHLHGRWPKDPRSFFFVVVVQSVGSIWIFITCPDPRSGVPYPSQWPRSQLLPSTDLKAFHRAFVETTRSFSSSTFRQLRSHGLSSQRKEVWGQT